MNKDLFPEYVIFILTVAFVVATITYTNEVFSKVNEVDCNHSVYCCEVK